MDILEGRKADPRFYPVVFGLADGDDWTQESSWYKANPSLGHTIAIDKVRDAYAKALENPAEENIFRQLRLNQWVKQSVRWMPIQKVVDNLTTYDYFLHGKQISHNIVDFPVQRINLSVYDELLEVQE